MHAVSFDDPRLRVPDPAGEALRSAGAPRTLAVSGALLLLLVTATIAVVLMETTSRGGPLMRDHLRVWNLAQGQAARWRPVLATISELPHVDAETGWPVHPIGGAGMGADAHLVTVWNDGARAAAERRSWRPTWSFDVPDVAAIRAEFDALGGSTAAWIGPIVDLDGSETFVAVESVPRCEPIWLAVPAEGWRVRTTLALRGRDGREHGAGDVRPRWVADYATGLRWLVSPDRRQIWLRGTVLADAVWSPRTSKADPVELITVIDAATGVVLLVAPVD